MNANERRERLRGFFVNSKGRMARLVELKAPDVIIANEARILLRSYHGGCWPAIRHWVWKEIQRAASDALWAARVWWYRALHDATYEQAADVLLDRMEQKESRKGGAHA